MADFRVSLSSDGSFSGDMASASSSVSKASSAAMAQCGELALSAGRASIASAGFGTKWQQGLKAEVSEKSVFIHHEIPYSAIFEDGGVIRGNPILWIPLPSTPKTIGGQRTTAKLWAARVGKLIMLKGPSGKPMLYGTMPGTKRRVPLFVGEDAVTIPKKFDVEGAVRRATEQLPALYEANRGTL
jgi:Family of unknown function (DUF6441)